MGTKALTWPISCLLPYFNEVGNIVNFRTHKRVRDGQHAPLPSKPRTKEEQVAWADGLARKTYGH